MLLQGLLLLLLCCCLPGHPSGLQASLLARALLVPLLVPAPLLLLVRRCQVT